MVMQRAHGVSKAVTGLCQAVSRIPQGIRYRQVSAAGCINIQRDHQYAFQRI